MTHRERLEAKLEKREEWAQGRRAKAARLRAVGGDLRHDWAFITQPGRIPERERMNRRDAKAHEHQEMAAHHESAAAGLADQLDRAIFTDDADATAKTKERIAEREAERDRIKAYNKSCRAAVKRGDKFGDLSLLSEAERNDLLSIARVAPYQLGKGGSFPAYKLPNLAGRIKADRDKLKEIEQRAELEAEAEAAPGGVLIRRHVEWGWCSVTFAEKPDREILDALKAAFYNYSRGTWSGRLEALPAAVAALEES